MTETPFFFGNGSYNLFGIFHEPSESRELGFVFVHPFAEEKLWTHRVYVSFARELAGRGYPVLRFDVMGHGDSDGNFEDSSIETRLSDIECAVQNLRDKVPSIKGICLLGLRFGATLASIAAEREKDIHKLILWEPVTDGSKYMQEMLRINLTTQTAVYKEIRYNRNDLVEMMKNGNTVNIDGYEICYDFFEQASSINLVKQNLNFTGDCLIVQVSRKERKIKKDLNELAAGYPNADIVVAIEEPFWKEIKVFYSIADNLFNSTLEWLERK
jgi:exosortase A-associated hydrolase 2